MADILHFPDRSLLKLIDAVNGVLDGSCTATTALDLAETVLRDMGAAKDENGRWQLPGDNE
jgi:hypothetical protein